MKHTMIWDEKGDTRGSDIHNTSEAEGKRGWRGGRRERKKDRIQREGRQTDTDIDGRTYRRTGRQADRQTDGQTESRPKDIERKA